MSSLYETVSRRTLKGEAYETVSRSTQTTFHFSQILPLISISEVQ